jgi:hypothetical protein
MTDTSYHSGGNEDLPRTVRQQKEARARDQAAREILNPPRSSASPRAASSMGSPLASDYRGSEFPVAQSPPGEYPRATVSRLQLPFLHMVGFFLKAVIAAIPALILLMLILWGAGQIAKHFLPWLVQMKIDITFPR